MAYDEADAWDYFYYDELGKEIEDGRQLGFRPFINAAKKAGWTVVSVTA